MRIVVTGGAGFVGSAICRLMVAQRGATVLNVDKLSATSSLASLSAIAGSPRYSFRKASVCDRERLAALLNAFAPDAIVHAAASSSGQGKAPTEDDLLGAWRLLEATRDYVGTLSPERRERFRLLALSARPGDSTTGAVCRAAADELFCAWHKSFGLPTIVARAAPVFGPYQFPDAAVAAATIAAIEGEPAFVPGGIADGWLFVEDLAEAVSAMLARGVPGAAYTVAGRGQLPCAAMAERVRLLVERHGARGGSVARDASRGASAKSLQPVTATVEEAAVRLHKDTGWQPAETLDTALSRTARWYLANEAWWRPLRAAHGAGNDFDGVLRIA